MRAHLAILALLGLPVIAIAQPAAPITVTPLLPPSVQNPMAAPPPKAAQLPADQPVTGSPPQPAAPMQLKWVAQGSVLLQLLDKVNAQNSVVTVKVGQQAQFGSLTIRVQACNNHPPDQPRDSAAYLAIADSRPDAPGFRGWVLANNPSLSMLQHPIYDVRVVDCRA